MTDTHVQAVGTMPSLYVKDLAARRADWASTRQAAIAGNIANADTPRYKARDIGTFQVDQSRTHLDMMATKPGHMRIPDLQLRAEAVDENSRPWDVKHSANTVSLDAELMKADETARHHQLSLSVMGAFHRMMLQAVSFR